MVPKITNPKERLPKKGFGSRFITRIKAVFSTVANPRFLFCYGLSWCITNGWAYALLMLGNWMNLTWMQAIAGGYLTFIWLPATPEKLITLSIAILLLRLLFPRDKKTLAVLKSLYQHAKEKRSIKKKNSDIKQSTNT